jgi:GT2 family glycosyltransferase
MKLSVIISAHNEAHLIGQQLEALSAQKWSEPWELIVVNNRSTDATVKVAETFRDRIPNLRVIDANDRQGKAHAINVAARVARGESLAFCDADDVVGEGWIEAMGTSLAAHEFVSGPLETERLNGGRLQMHRLNPQPTGLQEYVYPPYLPHAAGSNIGIRRDVFERVGGFDESMYKLQDTDFCWRVQLAGIKLVAVSGVVVHYRFRGGASSLIKQAFTNGIYNVFIYKKYRAHGMPKLAIKHGIASWIGLATSIGRLTKPEMRAYWLWDLGWLSGRLYASIKYRVLAL